MRPELRDWWITVRLDACRTCDYRLRAPTAYSAGWLWRQLHPGMQIIHIRPTTSERHD